jgi:5'-3' exonuclease, C-terminal SAM fold
VGRRFPLAAAGVRRARELSLSLLAGSRTPKRPGSRRTTFSRRPPRPRSKRAASSRAAIATHSNSLAKSTTILYPVRAGEVVRIGPDQVCERYGVDPKQVPDFIALRGDPSDKIPGALGAGPQRAGQLVRRYETLDGVLAAGLFPMQAGALRLYRAIAACPPGT